jgi:hypothetical protein
MSCSVTNIRIEPVNVSWEIEEQWDVKCVADVSSSLNNKWFKLGKAGQTAYSHYVWISTGTGVDPAPSGLTGIPVVIAADAAASVVATAVAAAVDANAFFLASADGDTVEITNATAGEASGIVDGTAATGFTFEQCQDGLSVDLGYLDGDVEISTEENTVEVNSHQSGSTILADLRAGVSSEVSLVLKESDLDKLKAVFAESAGGSYTPVAGTELFGWGTSRQGLNTIIQSRRLIMHPVASSVSDKSRDLCFWKAYAKPSTLTFSGENPRTVEVTFACYLDTSKPEEIQLFSIGDWSQLVPLVP